MSTAFNLMAWQEILARVMKDLRYQRDVSPEWLVNPVTHRRLKLDQYYPDVGLAVRYVGLTARGQPRQSEWELLEEEQRDQIRAELCRLNGVELFLLDPTYPHPREQLLRLRTMLSRCSRKLAQSRRPEQEKAVLMPQLADARTRLEQVSRKVKGPDDLALYAELWRDRETAALAATRVPSPSPRRKRSGKVLSFKPGQPVNHSHFGPGVVLAVNGNGGDPQITVQFEDGSERTFLASLAADKLSAA